MVGGGGGCVGVGGDEGEASDLDKYMAEQPLRDPRLSILLPLPANDIPLGS